MEPQLMRSSSKCIGCGYCITVCAEGAIVHGDEGLTVDRNKCVNCMKCVEVCAAEAMSVDGEWKTVEEIMKVVIRDRGFYGKSGGGMTISGGELLSQASFAGALLDAAREENITVALDTSGCGDGGRLFELAQKAQYVLYDMKCILNEGHRRYTGRDNTLILDNLRRLAADPEIREKIIMRMPLIHDVNDMPDVILATRDFYRVNGLKAVTLLAYHELGISKCKGIGREAHVFQAPSHERMLEIRDVFAEAGMQAEILGEEIA